jgi:cell division protein FtsW
MSQISPARLITLIVVTLTLFGLVMVGNVSSITASKNFGDKWYYVKAQASWSLVGLTAFFILRRISPDTLEKLSLPLLGLSIILLALVLIPGIGIKVLGARRWLNLGFATFQPSELAKLSLCVYLSALLKTPKPFLSFFVIVSIFTLLIMLQPDLGTAIITAGISLSIYIGSGGNLLKILSLSPVIAIVIGLFIFTSPYRSARLKTYLNLSTDPLGSSYQVRQAVIGLGSGGFLGVGLGQSRQKYEFLPEVTTDSIFTVIGEELGFVGAALLTLAYTTLTLLGLKIAATSKSRFTGLMSCGISSWFGLQSFVNISANVALLPFTGVPLPFISYGGSALLLNLIAAALLVAAAKKI